MTMFFLGLALFFGIHVVTLTQSLRQKCVGIIGTDPWRGLVALLSVIGLALMGLGWKNVPVTQIFAPSMIARLAAPVSISVALVLVVIGGVGLKAHLRLRLHHPMVIGVMIWSLTHLIANGGLRETWLFGSFLVFSLYAFVVLFWTGKRASFNASWKWDVWGVVIGLFVAIGLMHTHKLLFGVSVF